jgi:hypothetical protein
MELFYCGKSRGIGPRLVDRVHGRLVHQLTTLIKCQLSKIRSTTKILKPEPFSYYLIRDAHHETDDPPWLWPMVAATQSDHGGGSIGAHRSYAAQAIRWAKFAKFSSYAARAVWEAHCHTPFRERGNEASIRVPRMFKSHAWQQYDKQMKCYK